MNAALRAERPRREAGALTRRKLIDVGRRAFARKGHAGTNLRDDILVPAGVSVGSFYHQFRDKTDLFLAILRDYSEKFLRDVHRVHTPVAGAEPIDLARESFATCFRIAEDNADVFHILLRERDSDDPRVRRYLQESRRDWIASLAADYRRLIGSADEATTELAAEFISSLTYGTLITYLELTAAERRARRTVLIDGLVQFTLGGLARLLESSGKNTGRATPGQPRNRTRKRTGGR